MYYILYYLIVINEMPTHNWTNIVLILWQPLNVLKY